MNCDEEEDEENQNDKIETDIAPDNFLARARFSFNELRGNRKRRNNDHECLD